MVSGCTAVASDGMKSKATSQHGMGMMSMHNMDANRDGVISKQEFMSAHETMFDQMKNKEGVIDAEGMEKCCAGMMGGHMKGGMKGGMEGHSMMGSCPMMQGHMGGKSS